MITNTQNNVNSEVFEMNVYLAINIVFAIWYIYIVSILPSI